MQNKWIYFCLIWIYEKDYIKPITEEETIKFLAENGVDNV